ncbi:MAG: histidine kinase [Rubrivivax sp.]|nr:histidine kinase [Rubrivivax sp.]
MDTLTHNAGMPTPRPADFLRPLGVRFLINQAACTLLAVLLWQFRVDISLWESWVFSMLIGNACWLLIDGGLRLAAAWVNRDGSGPAGWPGWGWAVPIVVVGTLAGYLAGHSLARLALGITGSHETVQLRVLMISLVAALVISYVFYARERMHAQHLQAVAAERLATEMQLELLQSQLEPHMLFNTLANLRVLIGLDAAQAQGMLDHLIAFLRTTLASTRVDRHALASEFEALNDYLALMRVRMGQRLQPHFELPAPLRDLPVPPLLLQPLVENAIRHGLEPQVEGGRLEIGARRLGDQLQLRVRDTGVGPSAAAAGGSPGSGFGLELVRTRLATLYGGQASLTVQPAADAEGGTEALILLPLRTQGTRA